jgi:hypothetical protein
MLLDLFRQLGSASERALLVSSGWFLGGVARPEKCSWTYLRSNPRGEYFIQPKSVPGSIQKPVGCEGGPRDGWGIYVLVHFRGPQGFEDLAPVAPDFSGALRVLTGGFAGIRILAAH